MCAGSERPSGGKEFVLVYDTEARTVKMKRHESQFHVRKTRENFAQSARTNALVGILQQAIDDDFKQQKKKSAYARTFHSFEMIFSPFRQR